MKQTRSTHIYKQLRTPEGNDGHVNLRTASESHRSCSEVVPACPVSQRRRSWTGPSHQASRNAVAPAALHRDPQKAPDPRSNSLGSPRSPSRACAPSWLQRPAGPVWTGRPALPPADGGQRDSAGNDRTQRQGPAEGPSSLTTASAGRLSGRHPSQRVPACSPLVLRSHAARGCIATCPDLTGAGHPLSAGLVTPPTVTGSSGSSRQAGGQMSKE